MKRRLLLAGKEAMDFKLTAHAVGGDAQKGQGTALGARSREGPVIESRHSLGKDTDGSTATPEGMTQGIGRGSGALEEVKRALKVIGASETDVDHLLRGVSAVLHLGQASMDSQDGL